MTRSKRVATTDLSPGLRTVLSDFERAVRDHAFKGAEDPEDWTGIEEEYERCKQTLLRKLIRTEAATHERRSS